MKKGRIIWLTVTCLMVLSLVLTSCGQAPAVQTTPTTKVAPTAAATAPATTAPAEEKKVAATTSEKPKYGGTLILGLDTEWRNLDEVTTRRYQNPMLITNESLWGGDWTLGAAGGYGANLNSWDMDTIIWGHNTGYIAEKWEFNFSEPTSSMTFNIRKGVKWALNPNSEASRLVNGREVTADDVKFSIEQNLDYPKAQLGANFPEMKKGRKITTPDKWTVKIELPADEMYNAMSRMPGYVDIFPREVFEKYGPMTDWKLNVGTGPFMLTDYTKGSSMTFAKNTNYWMKDPIGPGKGNQLPYADGIKVLFILDESTRMAAIRTGKIDWNMNLPWEDAAQLKKQVPQLKWHAVEPNSTTPLSMRIDQAPFNDIRVRRAMMMAIDFEGIKNNYFGGNAQIVTFPITWTRPYASAYLGLDDPDMPASVKELYTYNPEKAKALLKEAGYPQGFKTNAEISNTPDTIDYYSLIKDMWAKVGINLEMRPMESAALNSRLMKGIPDQLMTPNSRQTARLYYLAHFYGPVVSGGNQGRIDDPVVTSYYPKIQRAALVNEDEANRLFRELMKYVLDQAWAIPEVLPPVYTAWWPWLKNYSGEYVMGSHNWQWVQFIWIDEALKKSMGY